MDQRKSIRKIPQNELRRLMAEHKSKPNHSGISAKIESPLAKYNDAGKLICILCRTDVRSNIAWKVHVNSRQHKANVDKAKELQVDILQHHLKPQKQSHTNVVSDLSSNYEDVPKSAIVQSSSKKDYLTSVTTENALPNNFFDTPARQYESKNPIEDEWEKFQKEIKEESVTSTAIIAGEQETATLDRQIQEINEQIFLWSKIVRLEDKKNGLRQPHVQKAESEINGSIDTSDESDSFEEFQDWRLKKFSK